MCIKFGMYSSLVNSCMLSLVHYEPLAGVCVNTRTGIVCFNKEAKNTESGLMVNSIVTLCTSPGIFISVRVRTDQLV